MSNNNIKLEVTNNQNKWINWIDNAISENYFKYYDFKLFTNIQEIGAGSFGKVYRANWNNSHRYFALKSFFNLSEAAVKEIVNEVSIKSEYVQCTVHFVFKT